MASGDFDPERMLVVLAEEGVQFVLIGGMAAILHGDVGVTVDLDGVPHRGAANLERLARALRVLGARIRTEGEPDGSAFDCSAQFFGNLSPDAIVNMTTDEARHVSYGLIYMKDELPRLPDDQRNRIEDFAFGAVDAIGGRRPGTGFTSQMAIFEDAGIDFAEGLPEFTEKMQDKEFIASQPDPIRDHVIPQLKRIDLITERTAPKYRELGYEL